MIMELRRALYNISALADLGEEIVSAGNFRERMKSAFYVITGTFLASKGAILSYDKASDRFAVLTEKGFDPEALRSLSPAEIISSGKKGPCLNADCPSQLPNGAEVLVCLRVRDEPIGALLLGGRITGESYTQEDLELLGMIGNQIAIALNNHALFQRLSEKLAENQRLYEEMRNIYHGTLQAFAAAIDAKDAYTKNHSHRVAKYSVAIARELGWSEHDIEGIYVAGYLHDIGKLAISNDLLNKVAPFTDEELEEIKKHTAVSHSITSKIKFPWGNVDDMVWHHHERIDGHGYPEALSDKELSEGVRIITLADSFDAMTSKRPYREKMDLRYALEELKKGLDRQFDNRILLAFLSVLDKEVKGELPEAEILPHLESESDISVISSLLEGIIAEVEFKNFSPSRLEGGS